MDQKAIVQYISDGFEGLDVVVAPGATFFFYDPGRTLPVERRQPFATIVSSDDFDRASDLERPGVFRLNLGMGRERYRARFGEPPAWPGDGDAVRTGHDFTQLDRLLPHPVYAPLGWVCVLNPSEATFEEVRGLLAEAYELAVSRYLRRPARG
jgi:uncharacterized protein DUF6194